MDRMELFKHLKTLFQTVRHFGKLSQIYSLNTFFIRTQTVNRSKIVWFAGCFFFSCMLSIYDED